MSNNNGCYISTNENHIVQDWFFADFFVLVELSKYRNQQTLDFYQKIKGHYNTRQNNKEKQQLSQKTESNKPDAVATANWMRRLQRHRPRHHKPRQRSRFKQTISEDVSHSCLRNVKDF